MQRIMAMLGINKGTLIFTPSTAIPRIYATANSLNSKPAHDITDFDYFDMHYHFIVNDGGGAFQVISPGDPTYSTTLNRLNYYQRYPNIWIQADSAAKSFLLRAAPRYRSCNEWKHCLFTYLETGGPVSYLYAQRIVAYL